MTARAFASSACALSICCLRWCGVPSVPVACQSPPQSRARSRTCSNVQMTHVAGGVAAAEPLRKTTQQQQKCRVLQKCTPAARHVDHCISSELRQLLRVPKGSLWSGATAQRVPRSPRPAPRRRRRQQPPATPLCAKRPPESNELRKADEWRKALEKL